MGTRPRGEDGRVSEVKHSRRGAGRPWPGKQQQFQAEIPYIFGLFTRVLISTSFAVIVVHAGKGKTKIRYAKMRDSP